MAKQYQYFATDLMIRRILREELIAQGHNFTGTLAENISVRTAKSGDSYTFSTYMLNYAYSVNYGIPANEISWSVYPQLVDYFIKKGIFEHDAKRIAAATINKWKKEGMPTEASLRFSKTGTRKNFIEETFRKWDERINALLEEQIEIEVNAFFLKEKSETI